MPGLGGRPGRRGPERERADAALADLRKRLRLTAADQLAAVDLSDPRRTKIACEVADALIMEEENERADTLLARVPPSPQAAIPLQFRAEIALRRGHIDRARQLSDDAFRIVAATPDMPLTQSMRVLTQRARLLADLHDATADRPLMLALQRQRVLAPDDALARASLLHDLGNVLLRLDRPSDAVAPLDEALKTRRELLRSDDWPGVAETASLLKQAQAQPNPGLP